MLLWAMNQKLLTFILALWCAVASAGAQQTFYPIDWAGAAGHDSIPVVQTELELPGDFERYEYRPVLEFPELVRAERKWVELAEKSGWKPVDMPELNWRLAVSAKKGHMLVDFLPLVSRDGVIYRVASYTIKLHKSPYLAFARKQLPQRVYADHSAFVERRFVKVKVSGTGVHRITEADLRGMGFEHPERVAVYGYGGNLLSNSFGKHPGDDVPPAPMRRVGKDILFYARGTVHWEMRNDVFTRVQNFYANDAYYFLAETEENVNPVQETAATGEAEQVLEVSDAYALYERDQFSWSTTGRELYDSENLGITKNGRYTFSLPGITGQGGTVLLAFSSKAPVVRELRVQVNGQQVGVRGLSVVGEGEKYRKAVEEIFQFSWTGENKENTTVGLSYSGHEPAMLNYLILNYKKRLKLTGNSLDFRSRESVNRATRFVVDGADANTEIWDVTSSGEMQLLKGKLEGSRLSVTVPAGGLREFVAVNTAAKDFMRVQPVGEVAPQDLHALRGVEMVILTPEIWKKEADRLAKAHEEVDGMKVAVVTSNQVYNEFSSGTPDVTAYRRLMKMLYDRAQVPEERPKYLLLFGDCAYDNRMVSNEWRGRNPDEYLLGYQSENSVSETESYMSDDYIGMLDDGEGEKLSKDILDIGIGRFPVRTAQDAKVVVDKTIDYMKNEHGGEWKRTVCYMSDDADTGNSSANGAFMEEANYLAQLAEKAYPNGVVKRLLPDVYKYESTATGGTYPEMKRLMFKYLKDGLLVLNYTGHSNTTSWSVENLLTMDDIANLKSEHLALWVTASCEFTRMDALNPSGGELVMVLPGGGAIALVSTTRVVYDSPNQAFNNLLTEQMYKLENGKAQRLGDIFRKTKAGLAGASSFVNTNKMNFVLIGDPALRLGVPNYGVQVDEVNAAEVDGQTVLQAGGMVTVKGHVLTPDGQLDESFEGTVHPLVFDSKEEVSTLDAKGSGVITYEEFSKVLFNSVDSVKNGRFELNFPVPLDIKYSNEQGRMNLFAFSADKREACGVYDSFIVGGTSDQISDNAEGPKVSVYLNEPDFEWGGKVNETPYFVATLEDEDGINTVGNGIGHDLTLVIDGNLTYPLNEYYVPETGSYKKGKVAFSIPELTEGKHRLEFRSWDILNNSSLTKLEFEVVKGLRPKLFDVTVTESPARESTTFVLQHNRPESVVQVEILVYDFAGHIVWKHQAEGLPEDGYYRVDWNLLTSGGQRLVPGVYVYRASLSSKSSKESTKARKIVVLEQ